MKDIIMLLCITMLVFSVWALDRNDKTQDDLNEVMYEAVANLYGFHGYEVEVTEK